MKNYLIFATFMAVYAGLCAVPGEWLWFAPTAPVIADSHVGEDPTVKYVRQIKRVTGIRYSVILRTGPEDEPACVDEGGPFDYKPSRSGPSDNLTLSKWTPRDLRCRDLPAGLYYGQVTWTIVNPYRDLLPEWLKPLLGGIASIIPPKEIRRDIPVFERLPKEGE